jgi:hypothetical protein
MKTRTIIKPETTFVGKFRVDDVNFCFQATMEDVLLRHKGNRRFVVSFVKKHHRLAL